VTQVLPVSLLRKLAMELQPAIEGCWRATRLSESIPAVFFVGSDYLELSKSIHDEILSVTLGTGSGPLRRITPRYRESLELLNKAGVAVREITVYARKYLPSTATDRLTDLSPHFDEHMELLHRLFGQLNEVHLLLQEHFSLSLEVYETNVSDSKELSGARLREERLRKRNKRFALLRKSLDEYFLNPTQAGLDAYIEEAEAIGSRHGGFLALEQSDPELAEQCRAAFASVVAASLMEFTVKDSAV